MVVDCGGISSSMNLENGFSEEDSGSQEHSGGTKCARDLALGPDEGDFLPWCCFHPFPDLRVDTVRGPQNN